MLKLRTFQDADAAVIVNWIADELALRRWSADRYGDFPIHAEDICAQYAGHEASDTLFPMTLEDGGEVVGHILLRFPGSDRKTIRFGFVIVDDNKRGLGCGRKLLQLAIQHTVETFSVETITLGVFDDNLPAYRCYQAVGFQDAPQEEYEYYSIMGQNWKCLEMVLAV